MKCVFINDTDTDITKLPESEQAKVKPRVEWHRNTGVQRIAHYFPAGTELEHPDAWKFVNFGMAKASDDECEQAIKPLTDEDRSQLEKRYLAAAKGIHDPDDVKLFCDDVILGYEHIGDQVAYVAGPNWDAWRKTNLDKKPKQEEDDI